MLPVTEPLPEGGGGPGAKGLRGSGGSWVRPLRGPPPPAAFARGPRHFPPDFIRRGVAAAPQDNKELPLPDECPAAGHCAAVSRAVMAAVMAAEDWRQRTSGERERI